MAQFLKHVQFFTSNCHNKSKTCPHESWFLVHEWISCTFLPIFIRNAFPFHFCGNRIVRYFANKYYSSSRKFLPFISFIDFTYYPINNGQNIFVFFSFLYVCSPCFSRSFIKISIISTYCIRSSLDDNILFFRFII